MAIYSSDLIITSLNKSPSRVVCLVPSTTDSLLTFGLGEKLVGVTDFCQVDEIIGKAPERIGGTKSADINKVVALMPDLIIANQEENDRQIVETLADEGIPIWLSFPKSAEQAITDLWTLVRIFGKERELASQMDTLERSLEWTRLAFLDQPRLRYFCPIWREGDAGWWMTFNQDTYANDILACCGGDNVFSRRERRYPLAADVGEREAEEAGDRDLRYPRVALSEIITAKPELILLPSEPYPFGLQDVHEISDLLAETPAASTNQIYLVDGPLITWHGIKIAEAISTLPRYFQSSERESR